MPRITSPPTAAASTKPSQKCIGEAKKGLTATAKKMGAGVSTA